MPAVCCCRASSSKHRLAPQESVVAQRDLVGSRRRWNLLLQDKPVPARQGRLAGRLTMNWTVSALRTILAVVRRQFGPFFTTSLVFNAPLLIVDLIDGGIVASLVIGLIANVLVTVSLTLGTLRAMAGARPDVASCYTAGHRPGKRAADPAGDRSSPW